MNATQLRILLDYANVSRGTEFTARVRLIQELVEAGGLPAPGENEVRQALNQLWFANQAWRSAQVNTVASGAQEAVDFHMGIYGKLTAEWTVS